MKKRIGAVLTALAMCAAMLPVSAMATSINKTADGLDDNKTTDVTLSVGSTQDTEDVAVLFLLDYSTSVSVRGAAADLLSALAEKENTNIKACVINYWADQDEGEWTTITPGMDTDSLLETTQTGGTNLHGGLLAAQEALQSSEIAGYETYVITISDGLTYLWTDEATGDTMSVWYQNRGNGPDDIQNGNSVYDMKYHGGEIDAAQFDSLVNGDTAAQTKYANTEPYFEVYGSAKPGADETDRFISYNGTEEEYTYNRENYLIGTEIAIYKSAEVFQEIAAEADHVFTLKMDENHWGQYPYGEQLMDYMVSESADGSGLVTDDTADTIFAGLEDKILYEVQSGVVTDVISPYFDLTGLDTFTMTRGAETLSGTVEGNTVTFDNGNYVVTYDGDKTFTWAINTPVVEGNGLTLTYNLTLDQAAVDADEDLNKNAVPTNTEATLDYVSTNGNEGTDTFPIPNVSLVEKESEPGMDKKADGEDSIGYVQVGDVITFTLNSNLPQELGDGSMIFYDTMTNLELNEGTLSVKIYNHEGNIVRDLSEENGDYVLNTDPEGAYTFTVALDLSQLLEDGVISQNYLDEAYPIVVSYEATVTDQYDLGGGTEVSNGAFVNDSNVDIVDGELTDDTPGTGGSGTLMFTVGGAALLAAAGALFVVNRRKNGN
mgnify:CR=1 FL=1